MRNLRLLLTEVLLYLALRVAPDGPERELIARQAVTYLRLFHVGDQIRKQQGKSS